MLGFKCLLKELFDFECAGCGGTRMFLSILKLDFYQAFRYNPGMFVLLVAGVIYVIYNVIRLLRKKKIFVPKTKWFVIVLVLLIIYMILRNLPGFEFLLPTEV